jgi:hypothetical protein
MTASPGSPSLFSEPLLVVRQKPEIVDSTPYYAISDQNGSRVGSVADVGQRDVRAAFRPEQLKNEAAAGSGSSAGGFMAAFKTLSSVARAQQYRLEVQNEAGVPVLVLTSAETFEERSLITVAGGDGHTIGTIAWQERLLRTSHYALEAGGQPVGTIVLDRRRSVQYHRVLDMQKREVARIAPQWNGRVARMLTREPESFAVQISLPLPEPLHSLVLAGGLTADTALKRHEPESGTTGS